jgi:hypothetical protein
MYQDDIKTRDQAVSHLFFHCCLRDGEYTTEELQLLSDRIVVGGLNQHLNFKEEIIKYRSYYNDIGDETSYIQFLVEMINPVNSLAIYSYCVELCLSDTIINREEGLLLQLIGSSLSLTETEQSIANALVLQRRQVETEKLY